MRNTDYAKFSKEKRLSSVQKLEGKRDSVTDGTQCAHKAEMQRSWWKAYYITKSVSMQPVFEPR